MVMNRYMVANNLTLKFDKMHFTKFITNNRTLTCKSISVVSVYTDKNKKGPCSTS